MNEMTSQIASQELPAQQVKSPCVRECCLDNQDICVGCNRSLNEILEWSEASAERKLEILANCRVRRLEKQHF
jgi:predicted Fe-S protein YdhL (DUF1289 family)